MPRNDTAAITGEPKSDGTGIDEFFDRVHDTIISMFPSDKNQDEKSAANLWQLMARIASIKDQHFRIRDQQVCILETLAAYFGADRGLLYTAGAAGRATVVAEYGYSRDFDPGALHLPASIAKKVQDDHKSVLVPSSNSNHGYESGHSTPSVLALPVRSHSRTKAILYFERDGSNSGFDPRDRTVGELVSEMVGRALFDVGGSAERGGSDLSVEKLLERFPVGLAVVDSDGGIIRMNPLSAEILDVNYSDIHSRQRQGGGISIWELLPDNQVSHWRYMITTALTSRQVYHEPSLELDTGYLVKTVSVYVSPWETAESSGVIVSLADVTETSILDEYLILSEKLAARGELADEVGRKLIDFHARMSQVAGNLRLLNERKQWDKMAFNISGLGEELNKLQMFAASLSDISRPATEFISYDIKVLIEDLLFSLRHQRQYKQIHFTVEMDHELPNLEIDVYQIQQLLRDLLDNAAEATERRAIEEHNGDREFERRIGIHVFPETSQDRVHISIRDNGTGLSPGEVARVFDLHYTTKAGAHGIGLYNCRRTAEMHHGEIVVGENSGGGTAIDVILPRVQPRSERSKEAE